MYTSISVKCCVHISHSGIPDILTYFLSVPNSPLREQALQCIAYLMAGPKDMRERLLNPQLFVLLSSILDETANILSQALNSRKEQEYKNTHSSKPPRAQETIPPFAPLSVPSLAERNQMAEESDENLQTISLFGQPNSIFSSGGDDSFEGSVENTSSSTITPISFNFCCILAHLFANMTQEPMSTSLQKELCPRTVCFCQIFLYCANALDSEVFEASSMILPLGSGVGNELTMNKLLHVSNELKREKRKKYEEGNRKSAFSAACYSLRVMTHLISLPISDLFKGDRNGDKAKEGASAETQRRGRGKEKKGTDCSDELAEYADEKSWSDDDGDDDAGNASKFGGNGQQGIFPLASQEHENEVSWGDDPIASLFGQTSYSTQNESKLSFTNSPPLNVSFTSTAPSASDPDFSSSLSSSSSTSSSYPFPFGSLPSVSSPFTNYQPSQSLPPPPPQYSSSSSSFASSTTSPFTSTFTSATPSTSFASLSAFTPMSSSTTSSTFNTSTTSASSTSSFTNPFSSASVQATPQSSYNSSFDCSSVTSSNASSLGSALHLPPVSFSSASIAPSFESNSTSLMTSDSTVPIPLEEPYFIQSIKTILKYNIIYSATLLLCQQYQSLTSYLIPFLGNCIAINENVTEFILKMGALNIVLSLLPPSVKDPSSVPHEYPHSKLALAAIRKDDMREISASQAMSSTSSSLSSSSSLFLSSTSMTPFNNPIGFVSHQLQSASPVFTSASFSTFLLQSLPSKSLISEKTTPPFPLALILWMLSNIASGSCLQRQFIFDNGVIVSVLNLFTGKLSETSSYSSSFPTVEIFKTSKLSFPEKVEALWVLCNTIDGNDEQQSLVLAQLSDAMISSSSTEHSLEYDSSENSVATQVRNIANSMYVCLLIALLCAGIGISGHSASEKCILTLELLLEHGRRLALSLNQEEMDNEERGNRTGMEEDIAKMQHPSTMESEPVSLPPLFTQAGTNDVGNGMIAEGSNASMNGESQQQSLPSHFANTSTSGMRGVIEEESEFESFVPTTHDPVINTKDNPIAQLVVSCEGNSVLQAAANEGEDVFRREGITQDANSNKSSIQTKARYLLDRFFDWVDDV
eukprot:MONOS_4627.2-p1 / transcript=MONOS_4627.2 / gene=MONOS_4627 / organism=Monocercomonoides_exilis_PA203 / gene_product=unspecified product / transcript_product=unspecified product / location=Mono_scaffold00125:30368-33785(+) / protein_length=1094 / sequence_SO=supercontig / SO=protein_coding / is_pseudo=false